MKTFWVYILTNQTRSVLYVGMTNSLEVRLYQHRNGETKSFTKRYHLNRLVYYEKFDSAGDAISREKQIKGWIRKRKDELVNTMNPKWNDLSRTLFPSSF